MSRVLCAQRMSCCGLCIFLALGAAAAADQSPDWSALWRLPLPASRVAAVGSVPELGADLENRSWRMVPTRYHQVHYQPTADEGMVAEVCSRIDNVYEFLAGRSPAKPNTPIRVFLVPNERARSRCSRAANAMRTGDQADAQFILASLIHEETHLFNFAYLAEVPQGWWAGEFFCLYFQERALWDAQGKDVKNEAAARLPNGPRCRLAEIQSRGKDAFDEAIAALLFLEERYGREKLVAFRAACLRESRKTAGGPLDDAVFVEAFDRTVAQLDAEWREFYGWGAGAAAESGASSGTTNQDKTNNTAQPEEISDPRLKTLVTYSTDKASIQDVVQDLAPLAGLKYDWNKSQQQAGSNCKRWVKNLRVENRPLHEVLKQILEPNDLTYKLEGDALVLDKK